MRLVDRPHYVYWHLGHDGTVLYVGVTWNVKLRHIAHRTDSPWWPEVAEVTSSEAMTREAAYQLETTEINRLQPPWNMRVPTHGTFRDLRAAS